MLAKDLEYTITDTQGPESQKIKETIQQDYLKMDIFYQTLNVKSISQSAKYPVSTKLQRLYDSVQERRQYMVT